MGKIEQAIFPVPAPDKLHADRQTAGRLACLNGECGRMQRGCQRNPVQQRAIGHTHSIHLDEAVGEATLLVVREGSDGVTGIRIAS